MNSWFEKVQVLTCALVLLAMFSGCAPMGADEEKELKTVIAKYNNALVEAYRNQFFEPLMEVAVEEDVRKVDIIISAYLQTNQIMDSELIRLDFKGIEKGFDRATVRTSEDWSYRWIDYRTNKEVEPLREIHYEMRYHLIKIDDLWMVERVEEVPG
jgi:hypothetical protein